MKKLAIIGASYLQEPLIEKAKSMGIETHVFAWAAGDIGEKSADFFYPISITEKEKILKKCNEIGIDGICTISSDLAVIAVNYVAENMGLIGNTIESSVISTNKHYMREAFYNNGDPSPKSTIADKDTDLSLLDFKYPIIIKPLDRSGSRGVTKIESRDETAERAAIQTAIEVGFDKRAIIEEFAVGTEYSVECLSWNGRHAFLCMTLKYTTGAPHFIETGHLEPAPVDDAMLEKVKKITFHALDSLKIRYGASHTELKIDNDGNVKLIEIGSRMGGDCIGSSLVQLTTGVDFVKAVIDVALGKDPNIEKKGKLTASGIRFVFSEKDIDILNRIKKEHNEYLVEESVTESFDRIVTDSSTRFGYYIFSAESVDDIVQYLPER